MRRRSHHGLARALTGVALFGAVTSANGCYQIAGYGDFVFTEPVHESLAVGSTVTKLDLLLVVDNSRQLGEAQTALDVTLDAFLRRLTNPPCVDGLGGEVEAAGPLEACPPGTERAFPPLEDIHIGVITSSLGGYGSGTCENEAAGENDHAHLQTGDPDQSYEGSGYLVWDPAEQLSPSGISDVNELAGALSSILGSLGQTGCGYEAPLEAWYRFLVDPDPYEEVIGTDAGSAPQGTDQRLLEERAAFLRPDSMVAIVVLSDENDCSMIDSGNAMYLANQSQRLPRPRAACKSDPDSPCCTSCALDPGPGCDTSGDDCTEPLTIEEDPANLRCFDMKRRFGIDGLFPIDRYVAGLTAEAVRDRGDVERANPLVAGRDPGLVLFTTISGVPWQDIARRRAPAGAAAIGVPDLDEGLDATGAKAGGLMNADELEAAAAWKVIVGDAARREPPSDPFMREQILPRAGENPIVGQSITTDASDPNPINGFDFPNAAGDTLQLACVYDLPAPIADSPVCDGGPTPLCEGTAQVRGGANPALRQLELASRLGATATVASACWAQLDDPAEPSYGYLSAFVGSIVDRIKVRLLGQPCLAEPLRVDANGRAACTILEARAATPGQCRCDAPARRAPTDDDKAIVDRAKEDPLAAAEGWNCFCFLSQPESEADLGACRTYASEPVVNEFGQRVDAWCYVDPTADPPLGDAAVAGCPDDAPRAIRLVGAARPKPHASLFLDCE